MSFLPRATAVSKCSSKQKELASWLLPPHAADVTEWDFGSGVGEDHQSCVRLLEGLDAGEGERKGSETWKKSHLEDLNLKTLSCNSTEVLRAIPTALFEPPLLCTRENSAGLR